jgi:Uma2 family endonuclease
MGMARIEPVLSYEHLRQLPDDGNRYEILDGRLVVTPAPSTRHQRAVWNVARVLDRAVQAGYGVAYVAPIDVVLHPTEAAVQPDLLFVAGDRLHIVAEARIEGPPDLIVEVLSDSTRDRDLGVKLRQYARHGVRWYWAVDPDRAEVRVFAWREGAYEEQPVLRRGDRLGCPLFPGVEADVAEVFA